MTVASHTTGSGGKLIRQAVTVLQFHPPVDRESLVLIDIEITFRDRDLRDRAFTQALLCTGGVNPLILGDLLSCVVWTFDTFSNNFGSNYKFTKYLKRDYWSDFDQYFRLIYNL